MFKTTGLILLAVLACVAAAGDPLQLYVSTAGNDSWTGALSAPNADGSDGPFATLDRARDELRARKAAGTLAEGAVVTVLAGTYELAQPFELSAEDSGAEGAEIVYRAARGDEVRISGGKTVSGFAPVTDAAVLDRLDEPARARVLQADLKAAGVGDYGPVDAAGLQLYFQDRPMTLARWPNEGFTRIVDIVEKDGHEIHGIPGSKTGRFLYEGDRPKRWVGEKDPWLHGYWFWDWSDQRQPIAAIDLEKSEITLKEPWHGYGYRKGQWYYAFNMLSELDAPGEWYLDRDAGTLYFWPPAPVEGARAVVSVLPKLVEIKDASHVRIEGLTFEHSRASGVSISGGAHNRVAGCTLRNIGGDAVSVSEGTDHGVVSCDLYRIGGTGISLSGSDRATLAPAGHLAENNHIHHYGQWYRMYHPAIALNGVGNRAANNRIHDAPHMAIQFGGNDHVIEYNDVYRVCEESNDAGAVYAGRNWTMRGTVIRYNAFRDITGFENRGCVGVYLDDMFCGTTIFGNTFKNVTRAAFIGGGRDVTIENNVFVDCDPAIHVDARALNWAGYHADEWVKEGREKGTVSGIAYDKPPYSERYPRLVGLLDDEPKAPKGNLIARNICSGGRWDEVEEIARPYVTFQDNFVEGDPGFRDAANGDYRLRDDSPALKLGFQPIPVEKIGLYMDEHRSALPDDEIPARWSEERANAWYARQPWLVGPNFAPSTAINQLEMWQGDTFDPETIDRELGWAASIGFNTARVFLHHIPWQQDADGFVKRIDQFLAIADRRGIRPLFVLLDDVWNPNPKPGKQPDPTPGVHNSGWVQSPGAELLRDPKRHDELEGYVRGVVSRFAQDDRVLGWDLYNEPGNTNAASYGSLEPPDKPALSLALLEKVFRWAREANPSQPLTAGVWTGHWTDPEKLPPLDSLMLGQSDIVTFHFYGPLDDMKRLVDPLKRYNRPIVCTEYMSRPTGSTFQNILPYFKEQRIGAYNWGLVSGKSQTIYPWDSWEKPYAAEPELWFHDVFRADGTPYNADEVAAIRSLTGKEAPQP